MERDAGGDTPAAQPERGKEAAHDGRDKALISVADLEYFYDANLTEQEEITRVRAGGVTGFAYSRYRQRLGVHRSRDMHQLAACGVSSSRFGDFQAAGIDDIDLVCRLHLAGFTAATYLAFLKDLRDVCGVALGQRLLDTHVAPVNTLGYIKESVPFANWILQIAETELRAVVNMCENSDPGWSAVLHTFDEC